MKRASCPLYGDTTSGWAVGAEKGAVCACERLSTVRNTHLVHDCLSLPHRLWVALVDKEKLREQEEPIADHLEMFKY